jgi:hypothetical protein
MHKTYLALVLQSTSSVAWRKLHTYRVSLCVDENSRDKPKPYLYNPAHLSCSTPNVQPKQQASLFNHTSSN